MTRIQIRRDTSTNWSVNNPTPANGEPCYETDTRKFKIGDGVTKYTNLPYQGGGGTGDIPIATTTTAGKVKPDGTTITITDDGTISAVGGGGSADSYTKSETDVLLSEKNDNIFDISKFKVVGSPTITDDGVASGFSNSNVLRSTKTFAFNNKPFEIILPIYWSKSVTQSTPFHFSKTAWTNYLDVRENRIAFYLYTVDDGTNTEHTLTIWMDYNVLFNDGYLMCSIKFDGAKYTLKVWNNELNFIRQVSYSTSNLMNKADDLGYLDIGAMYQVSNGSYYKSSIDLKQVSITVDGKEVFNGLMNSTKPIYDAIKANNTELSNFKTETSNDFSAVNSALNEKANLSDLGLKQNLLISGTNIKTINGETILGEGNITVGGGGSAPANMVTTDTAQDITANKTFYGEIRVGADSNYATLAKFSKETLQDGDSTLLEHIDLGDATFVVQGNLGKKVYETDKYVYKKYINVNDLSDSTIQQNNSISSQVAHMAMPSDKYINLTLGASGTTYTAPEDGLFCFISAITTASGQFCRLIKMSASNYRSSSYSSAPNQFLEVFLPISKGQTVAVHYTAPVESFKFVYAVGSQPSS